MIERFSGVSVMNVVNVTLNDCDHIDLAASALVITSFRQFQIILRHAPRLLLSKYVLPLAADVSVQMSSVGLDNVKYWELTDRIDGDAAARSHTEFWKILSEFMEAAAFDVVRSSSYALQNFLTQHAFVSDVIPKFLAQYPDIESVIVMSWDFRHPAVAEMPSDAGAAVTAYEAARMGRKVIHMVLPQGSAQTPLHLAGLAGPVDEQLQAISRHQREHPRTEGRLRVAMDVTWLYRAVDVARALRRQGVELVFLLHGNPQAHLDVKALAEMGPIVVLKRGDEDGHAGTFPWDSFIGKLPSSENSPEGQRIFNNPFLRGHFEYYVRRYWPALAALSTSIRRTAAELDVDCWIIPATDIPSVKAIFAALGAQGVPRILLPHGIPFNYDPLFSLAEGYGFWSRGDASVYPARKPNAVKVVTGHLEPAGLPVFERQSVRARYGLPPEEPVVLLLSSAIRLGDAPCIHFGDHLPALQTLLRNGPANVHVAVRPKPFWDDADFYPAVIKGFGGCPRVSVLPANYERQDLFEQIAAADIVVTLNAFSTALLDAVRMGRPALCLSNTPTTLFWNEFFPPVMGHENFWSAMNALLDSPETYAALVKKQQHLLKGVEEKKEYSAELFALVSAVVREHAPPRTVC